MKIIENRVKQADKIVQNFNSQLKKCKEPKNLQDPKIFHFKEKNPNTILQLKNREKLKKMFTKCQFIV